MVHFKYRNTEPLGDLIFPANFWIEFYVDTTIDRPSYPIQEETREDQEGDVHKIFQRWEKQYTVSFMGVESLVDACSIIPLMDEVYVNGVRVYDIFVETIWDEETECLANITITYLQKKIIKTL